DAKAWMDGAHGLKGTARTLGLIRLADLSAEAQFAAEAGPSGVTADRFTAIEDALVDAMSAAHAYLAQSLAKAS
ncbi:MAG: Hpt domain-containing protein, partial [Pseudomonadota bacterium]